MESSLNKGPVSFSCYLNITVSLNDKNILKSIVLQIKTHNYKMLSGSIPIALMFRVHYKAMVFTFATKHLKHSPKGETIILQIDLSKSNTVIPRTIQWKDVTLPEEWILEGATQPQSLKRSEPNANLKNVT